MSLIGISHVVANSLQFHHGGLTEKEAEDRVKKMKIDAATLERFEGKTNMLHVPQEIKYR